MVIAEFESYELAMENSARPETDAFAKQMAELSDGFRPSRTTTSYTRTSRSLRGPRTWSSLVMSIRVSRYWLHCLRRRERGPRARRDRMALWLRSSD